MKVISGRLDKIRFQKTCVAIGIFDGVHRGHQYLLKAMLSKATHAKSVVITFFPHPVHVLRPDLQLGYLVSLQHRLKLLEALGVDACIVINFTKKFARIEPQAFIRDTLVKRLGAKAIFVGEDFHFGRNRAGDVKLFEQLAPKYGYEMHGMPALMAGGTPISSTRIRKLVTTGKLSATEKLLGRPFSMLGQVIKGSGRGKELGFPTANVAYESSILPPNGVYAVRVFWKNKILKGAANLGLRPSFREINPHVHLEVYILDFKQDFYGQSLEVQFIKKIRSEKKFASSQALIRQIKTDVRRIRQILK